MKKFLIAAALGATALTGVGIAAASAHQGQPQTHSRGFAKGDANGDGIITREEMRAAADARFTKLDVNKDGKLTTEESRAGFKSMRGHRGGRGHWGGPRGAFGQNMGDTNNDGVVTRAEMLTGIDARFGQMDTNKDGKIGADERRGGPGGGRMLERVDTDKDGAISLAEMRASAEQRFDAGDANKDGKIDQAERDKVREQFRGTRGDRQGPPPPPSAQ